ncbi:MAG: MFS transporter [Planctomycetales bacterium]|nr:MFS transporter [Planctomycetales bacterium]
MILAQLPLADFVSFVSANWQFCLLHFLEFAIWGAWYVVLGNLLNSRGFTRQEIGRIYATMPIGSMVSMLVIGPLVDKYLPAELVLGVSHLLGAALLMLMARADNPRPFYWFAFLYALAYSPTLNLVNAVVFAQGGDVADNFPWVRVWGTIGWIVAGLSHALLIRKGEPVNERPLLLAAVLSLVLGVFAFSLPPAPEVQPVADAGQAVATETGAAQAVVDLLTQHPVFFLVTFVAAMAMGLYFAFAALFIEKRGVPSKVVGPVMTIGQWIEIFFMFSLTWFLGDKNANMNWVLLTGILAWSIRFGLFAIGNPIPLVLVGIAIHGICFDFFFAAGMMNANDIAPVGLTATAQSLYGFLVYGLGMYLGSEGAGWLNQKFSHIESGRDGVHEVVTDWKRFWGIPCIIVSVSAALFALSIFLTGNPTTNVTPSQQTTTEQSADGSSTTADGDSNSIDSGTDGGNAPDNSSTWHKVNRRPELQVV